MKKTAWYPDNIKPVHIGVYETDLGPAFSQFGFSYWDGNNWSNQYLLIETAARFGDHIGVQEKRWRGVKEKA